MLHFYRHFKSTPFHTYSSFTSFRIISFLSFFISSFLMEYACLLSQSSSFSTGSSSVDSQFCCSYCFYKSSIHPYFTCSKILTLAQNRSAHTLQNSFNHLQNTPISQALLSAHSSPYPIGHVHPSFYHCHS